MCVKHLPGSPKNTLAPEAVVCECICDWVYTWKHCMSELGQSTILGVKHTRRRRDLMCTPWNSSSSLCPMLICPVASDSCLLWWVQWLLTLRAWRKVQHLLCGLGGMWQPGVSLLLVWGTEHRLLGVLKSGKMCPSSDAMYVQLYTWINSSREVLCFR